MHFERFATAQGLLLGFEADSVHFWNGSPGSQRAIALADLSHLDVSRGRTFDRSRALIGATLGAAAGGVAGWAYVGAVRVLRGDCRAHQCDAGTQLPSDHDFRRRAVIVGAATGLTFGAAMGGRGPEKWERLSLPPRTGWVAPAPGGGLQIGLTFTR